MGSIGFSWNKADVLSFFQDKVSNIQSKGQDLVIDVLNVFYLISAYLAPSLTGALRDSIQVFLGSSGGYVTSTLDYFIYVILGTEMHDIGSPVWIPQAVGWRYIGLSPAGRGSPHPGTKANDFMEDAYQEGQGEADIRMQNFLEWLAT
jgi:hypothetical protein